MLGCLMFGNWNSNENQWMHLEIVKEEHKTREKELNFMEELLVDMVGLMKTQKTHQQKEKESKEAWNHVDGLKNQICKG